MSPTLQDARLLWDFLGQGRCHVPCELLVVCGSYDLRVCDHACELLERSLAERLLFTGNTGHWTRHLWVEPEAELFARHARARGVSDSLIVIEPRATNFAENIAFARELFPDLRRATFVTKPNSIRRVALTLPVRWPGLEGHVDAPDYAFPDGISNLVGVLGVIDEMVGDLDRIIRYPALGFQVACPIPAQVMDAWERLVARGFDRHLVNPPR
ncbi:TPA: YdcF family protein [Pseudomonas aeruginosa]|nr:YdcF family protein [Pseudomonas aeruginosa]HCW0867540.1 YdcF family protein [Pseudomonas aeruginosa]